MCADMSHAGILKYTESSVIHYLIFWANSENLLFSAMRGCENPLCIDQSPAAKLEGRKEECEGNLPWRIPQIGILSSHNLGEVAITKIVTAIPSAGFAHCKKNQRQSL